jgi:hypothetical protein
VEAFAARLTPFGTDAAHVSYSRIRRLASGWPRARRDARRTGGASLAAGGDARRTRDGSRGAGGASPGTGGASRGTGGASLRVRTVALATQSDAPRTRGSALVLRVASNVGLYRIAPIASGIPTKTRVCCRKSERSARSSKRIAASICACTRYSDSITTNGQRCPTPLERCPTQT